MKYLLALLFTSSAFAKGPTVTGSFQGKHKGKVIKLSLKTVTIAAHSTSTRVTDCNFSAFCRVNDPQLFPYNSRKRLVTDINGDSHYIRMNLAFSKTIYRPRPNYGWQVNYVQVYDSGRIHNAFQILTKDTDGLKGVLLKTDKFEVWLKRI